MKKYEVPVILNDKRVKFEEVNDYIRQHRVWWMCK